MNKKFFIVLIALVPTCAWGNFDFTLATSNVLFESYYTGYSEIPTMPPADRIKAFQNAIDNPDALANTDIYCFQEWPGIPAFGQSLYDTLKLKNYQQVAPANTPKDSTVLLFNGDKFDALESNYKIFEDPKNRPNPIHNNIKAIVYAVLESKKEKQRVVVITVHVPYSPPKAGEAINPAYAASLAEIRQIIEQLKVKYHNAIWVLCGDFNFNAWDAKGKRVNLADYELLKNYLFQDPTKIEVLPILSNAEIATQPTAFGPNTKPEYEFNDYIFYSNNVSAQLAMYPTDVSQLIRHSQPLGQTGQQGYKDYFSDHAIIRAKFTKKSAVPVVEDGALMQSLNALTNGFNSLTETLEKAAF